MKFTIHILLLSSLHLSSALTHATASSDTDDYIAALAHLLEQKTIGDAELVTMLKAAEDGKVVNPISPIRAETSVEHFVASDALEELLEGEIDAARVATWAKENVKEQDQLRQKRKKVQDETKDIWKETSTVLSAGYGHSCAVTIDGTVTCWGDNEHGQASPPPGVFKSVSAGHDHSCGIRLDGTVECWGFNNSDECNAPPGVFVSVFTAASSTCGLKIDGTVECWGSGFRFYKPSGAFRSISANLFWKCGVRMDGSVECWSNSGPKASPSGTFKSVSAGGDHACGVKPDGSIQCWGENQSGQCTTPTGVFQSVVAGYSHSCGLKVDGTVVCWGYNGSGSSHAGSGVVWLIPGPSGTFHSISTSGYHACGVRMDGSVECWGHDGWKGNKYEARPPPWFLRVSIGPINSVQKYYYAMGTNIVSFAHRVVKHEYFWSGVSLSWCLLMRRLTN